MSYIWNNSTNPYGQSQQPGYIMQDNNGRRSMNYMSPNQSTANLTPGN